VDVLVITTVTTDGAELVSSWLDEVVESLMPVEDEIEESVTIFDIDVVKVSVEIESVDVVVSGSKVVVVIETVPDVSTRLEEIFVWLDCEEPLSVLALFAVTSVLDVDDPFDVVLSLIDTS